MRHFTGSGAMRRHFVSVLTGSAVLLLGVAAPASPLNGILQLPEGFSAPPRHQSRGYWPPVRNGVLNVLPPLLDPRQEMVVALQGRNLPRRSQVKPEVSLRDRRMVPPVLPVHPGGEVTFQNDDSIKQALTAKGGVALERVALSPGEKTRRSFPGEGTVDLQSAEGHPVGTVLVVEGGQLALPDAAGGFQFDDVPEGTYTLKVWFRGRWFHSQSVTVRRKTSVTVQLPAYRAKD